MAKPKFPNLKQPIQILSPRTSLRLIEGRDLEAIHQLLRRAEVDTYNTLGVLETKLEAQSYMEKCLAAHHDQTRPSFTLALEDREHQHFLGLFGLSLAKAQFKSAEVWYKIAPEYWNRGFATEALAAVIDYAFGELKLHRVHAGCAVANVGSIKVLEKVGMIREGRGRQILPLKSGWSDNFEYSILESDQRS